MRSSQLTTGRKSAPDRGTSTCKGPEARDPGDLGQEAGVAGMGWERKMWEVGKAVCPDSQAQGGVCILFSVHSGGMDLIKTSVLLCGQ